MIVKINSGLKEKGAVLSKSGSFFVGSCLLLLFHEFEEFVLFLITDGGGCDLAVFYDDHRGYYMNFEHVGEVGLLVYVDFADFYIVIFFGDFVDNR